MSGAVCGLAAAMVLPTVLCSACATHPSATASIEDAVRRGQAAITATAYANRIAALSADEFAGRKPGTPGEAKTLAYLEAEFQALGLVPVTGDSFRQSVPLVEITAASDARLAIAGHGASYSLRYGEDAVIWTRRVVTDSQLTDSELVFVGHGIVAPEYDWNDYAGIDMHGKTAVILINEPGFAVDDPVVFKGRALTYYGRWTYKLEEAARQGAAGALLVHDTRAAAYGWSVVQSGWTGPQLEAATADDNLSRPAIEGWVTSEAARRVLDLAGLHLDKLVIAASQQGFRAMPLNLRASAQVRNAIRRATSANLVGVRRGTRYPDEYLLYVAHWDHLGRILTVAKPTGDVIFNGAVDNATGVAGILTIAEAFKALAPERSIVFLAATGEEAGLLGSDFYAAQPLVPLAQTVAVFNIDDLRPRGRTRDVTVIGFGASELEDALRVAAAAQDRVLRPDPEPELGYFFRSDHFMLAKRGVPALYIKSGIDSREHGADWGLAQDADYVANRYHKVTDEFDPNWDLSGSVEDLQLLFAVGWQLANQRRFPDWYPDNEFRSVRDRSRSASGAKSP